MTPDAPTAEELTGAAPSVDVVPTLSSQPAAPPTAGMTTKVVKGSIWTLAGSVLPLGISFISTPFIIRFLGSEAYGVLLLVGLIPTYFSFADFGMGVASTKFASEAYGQGDAKKENEIVWTATAIAAVSAMIVAVPIFLFSSWIVAAMNVPDYLLGQAGIALKITSVAFVLGILSSVLNSPMLARLRMDLNTITQATPKVLLAAVTPVLLYFGFGIVAAVTWALIVGVATILEVFVISSRLLPALASPGIDREVIRPLLTFGGGWLVAMIAGVIIGNLERFLLTSIVSVKALAFYSIAFTFANLATLLSQALLQSLLPAFSQLMVPERRKELNNLFARGMRLAVVTVLPAVVFLFVIGKPFLTFWAGEEFGRESTIPFYILLTGFSLSIFSILPYASLLAIGRTDLFARMYWLELPFYLAFTWLLVSWFGIVGAALAYALRTVFDASWAIYYSRKLIKLRFGIRQFMPAAFAAALLFAPSIIFVLSDSYSLVSVIVAVLAFSLYGLLVWKRLLAQEERAFIILRIRSLFAGFV